MKRECGFWQQIHGFPNLLEAAKRAAEGKRTRPDVAAFLLNLEGELLQLQRELTAGSYVPGPYHTFTIKDPKPRRISAAPFRDRAVHHALTQVIEPIFERRFSASSFACRKGMGTHAGIEKARNGAKNFRYVLKCDVRKYFASVDHGILSELLAKVLKCTRTLDLSSRIIAGFKSEADLAAYYPGDDLFTPHELPRGLPLGNQTSQFFANVYLNPLDQMIDRNFPGCNYVRYVDDLVVFDNSLCRLGEMKEAIRQQLFRLRLDLHAGKSKIYHVEDGVTFLGWRIFPNEARLVRPNVVRFRRRMRIMEECYAAGTLSWKEIEQQVQAWLAHAAHGDTWKLRERLLDEFSFRGGRGTI